MLVSTEIRKRVKMKKKQDNLKPIELRNYVAASVAVRRLKLSESTVRNAIKRGTVYGFKFGRNWFLEKSEAEKQWNGGKVFNW